jgi:hypothetical protein
MEDDIEKCKALMYTDHCEESGLPTSAFGSHRFTKFRGDAPHFIMFSSGGMISETFNNASMQLACLMPELKLKVSTGNNKFDNLSPPI